MALLRFDQRGIFCEQAGIYIDPWKPVDKALITHGHADHSRYGHRQYLASSSAVPVIRHRLGSDISIEGIPFGRKIKINGVTFSFHPAGHIPGSAQIRIEYRGEVWVVSGDYKIGPDGISEPFEPVRCNVFITECTFGLPVYRWKPQQEVFGNIMEWWQDNTAQGKASVLAAYSLGKAQRILAGIDPGAGPVYTQGAVENINAVMRSQGIKLPQTLSADKKNPDMCRSLVIAPPSALGSSWLKKFGPYSTAMASGWMALRGARRRRAADRGFVLSDHADWDGLNSAIKETGASRIITTHGYTSIFSRWLNEQGFEAVEATTEFEGEEGGDTA